MVDYCGEVACIDDVTWWDDWKSRKEIKDLKLLCEKVNIRNEKDLN